jgi:hypothetical protein
VGREVLILRGREERLQVVERGGMLCLDMQRVQVNLKVDLSAQPKHVTTAKRIPSLFWPSGSCAQGT